MSDVKCRIDEHVKLFDNGAFAGVPVASLLRSGASLALYALDSHLRDEQMKKVIKGQRPTKHRDLTRWLDRELKALSERARSTTGEKENP